MKKTKRILITFLFILTIIVGALVIYQYDNIVAFINGMIFSPEDLAEKIDSNKQDLKSKVQKYISKPIEDITSEDEEKLLKGEITVEEIFDKYDLPLDVIQDENEDSGKIKDSLEDSEFTEDTDNKEDNNINEDDTADNPKKTNEPISIVESDDTTDNTKAIDEAVSTAVSSMYALKAKFVSKLGEVENKVYEEYTDLPKEKQNDKNKKEIVMKNIDYVAGLEKKCDEEVALVLSALEEELIKWDGDTELIQILYDAYEEEKELKKSYYLSIYNN